MFQDRRWGSSTLYPCIAMAPSGLADLRALGGNATWKRHDWKFTRIAELVKQEKGRPRSTEKTIRADLREAAQAERDVTRNGETGTIGLNWRPPA